MAIIFVNEWVGNIIVSGIKTQPKNFSDGISKTFTATLAIKSLDTKQSCAFYNVSMFVLLLLVM